MAWLFMSIIVVLFVVSLVFRKFFYGAICVLGVAGFLFYMYQQHTTQVKIREWSEAVSTAEEAAQAVQRLRAAQVARRQDQGEQSALAVPPADARQQLETIPPQQGTTVSSPSRPSGLSSEENDSREAAGTTTTPRVTPIPRVTVIPQSDIPSRVTLSSSTISTPSAVPTASDPPTPSAPTSGSALKSCDELKAEIQAKLAAKGITSYALIIMTSGDLQGLNVVGSCEGNTKKIVLNRSRNTP